MKKRNSTIVLIDDMISADVRPFKDMRDKGGYKIKDFTKIREGLEYIENNLDKKLIVILDFEFTENEPDGLWGLKKIREKSYLIPVILLTYNKNVSLNKFPEFINNKLFAYAEKDGSNDIINKVNEADEKLNNDISTAIEEWINAHPNEQQHKPVFRTSAGKSYSLNEISSEIKNQTETGIEFSKRLNKLTIDLLIRNKETLND